jgi:hypothetical protein
MRQLTMTADRDVEYGEFAITVDAGASHAGLRAALRSTGPAGSARAPASTTRAHHADAASGDVHQRDHLHHGAGDGAPGDPSDPRALERQLRRPAR